MSAHLRPLLPVLSLLAACLADDGSPPLATATETDSGTDSTGTTGTNGTNGTTGEPDPGLECPVLTPPEGPFTAPDPVTEMLGVPTVCSGLTPAGGVTVEVYYPGDEAEDPADGRFPVVLFHHGNGLNFLQYGFLFERLQQAGFVVLNVTGGASFSVAQAIDALRCALRWFYLESSYYEDIGSCDIVLSGHSRGGAAAYILRDAFPRVQFEPALMELDVRAMVLLASFDPEAPELNRYGPDRAVPLLALGTSTDEDVPGDVLTAYDRMAPEPEFVGVSPAPPAPYKGAIWIYDVPHTGLGGAIPAMGLFPLSARSGLSQSEYLEKGHTITASYVDRFLQWQLFGQDAQRPYFVGEAHPPEVLEPDWWDYLVPYRGSPAICDAIATETPCLDVDCDWTGSTCEGRPSCHTFETLQSCSDAQCVWDDDACRGRIPIFSSFALDTRLTGFRSVADFFEHDDSTVVSTSGALSSDLGPVSEIIAGVDLLTGHDTRGVFATVTSQSPGATISFTTQAVSTEAMNHASLRIGTRPAIDSDSPLTMCVAEPEDPVAVTVRLSNEDTTSNEILLPPIPQQDAMLTYNAPEQTHYCEPQLFLQTQRIAMTDLCEDLIVDLENVDTWTFSFPDGVPERDEVVIDTLEFTRSTDDAAVGTCSTQTGMWACEASSGLLPERPVCTAEPVSGACPSQSLTTQMLDVPEVPEEWGGPFAGWVVHMPAGYGDDPWDPPNELVDAMTARCVQACEQQWSHDPTVVTGCDDVGAFVDVSLLSTPSHGALRRISPLRTRGQELFDEEMLDCSLLDSCCEAFDENVCLAAPRRPTPAEYAVGVGQEYVVEIDSNESKLEVTDGETVSSVVLYGDVGFSRCRDGNDTEPCPFYLGSLTAKSIGSIKIPVTCPNQQVIHRTLYWLTVNLAQPAMGIAQEGTDLVGFPAGALVFDANFTLGGGVEMDVRGVTQVDVVGTAGDSAFEFGEIKVTGMMPACWGQDDIPVEGTFEIVLDLIGGIEASPPEIEIDIPATVSCPSNVDLDAIASDPDDDLDTVRWWIDDVLMSASTTSVTFTQGHTVRAVAYDERGAATTATKTITCQ
jgi:hypothetical protein